MYNLSESQARKLILKELQRIEIQQSFQMVLQNMRDRSGGEVRAKLLGPVRSSGKQVVEYFKPTMIVGFGIGIAVVGTVLILFQSEQKKRFIKDKTVIDMTYSVDEDEN
jgi:hypothetical protein